MKPSWERLGERHPDELRTLSRHLGWEAACALSADGNTALWTSDYKMLQLWDAQSGAELRILSGHSVSGCALSADGKTVLSACSDQTLKLWDARTGTARRTFSGHSGSVLACALSADGNTVLSASDDKTLKLWDARTGHCVSTVYGVAAFRSVAIGPDIVVAGDTMGNVWMLDLARNARPGASDAQR